MHRLLTSLLSVGMSVVSQICLICLKEQRRLLLLGNWVGSEDKIVLFCIESVLVVLCVVHVYGVVAFKKSFCCYRSFQINFMSLISLVVVVSDLFH